jgi:hypothetical protein
VGSLASSPFPIPRGLCHLWVCPMSTHMGIREDHPTYLWAPGLSAFPMSLPPSCGPCWGFRLAFYIVRRRTPPSCRMSGYPKFFPRLALENHTPPTKGFPKPSPFFHSFGFRTCGLSEPFLYITRRSGPNGHFDPVRLLHSRHTSPNSYSTFAVLLLSSLANS